MARLVSPWPMISIAEAVEKALHFTPNLEPSSVPLGKLLVRCSSTLFHALDPEQFAFFSLWVVLHVCCAFAFMLTMRKRTNSKQGKVLCEDVVSRETLPAVPTSIVDGYAVISSDGEGEFALCGGSRAGATADSKITVTSGNVCYITTGGPVPDGADAVVMVEDTEKVSEDRVKICKSANPRQNIREIGSDISLNEVVLKAGEIVGPAEVGLLATVGAVEAKVRPQPVVAIMSTGDELAEPDATGPLAPGVIRDSNR
jgi:molybdopterin biosynthesis enzyme